MDTHEVKKTEAVLKCFGLNTTQARDLAYIIFDPRQGIEEVVEQAIEYKGDN